MSTLPSRGQRGDENLPSWSLRKHFPNVLTEARGRGHIYLVTLGNELLENVTWQPGVCEDEPYRTVHTTEGSLGVLGENCLVSPPHLPAPRPGLASPP